MRIGDYRVDTVFGQMTPPLRGELVQFWLDEGALPDANSAWGRTDQAVCIARDAAERSPRSTRRLPPLQGPDEAFGLAVGLGGVGFGADVLELAIAAGVTEVERL
jgi:hypothetical protein